MNERIVVETGRISFEMSLFEEGLYVTFLSVFRYVRPQMLDSLFRKCYNNHMASYHDWDSTETTSTERKRLDPIGF